MGHTNDYSKKSLHQRQNPWVLEAENSPRHSAPSLTHLFSHTVVEHLLSTYYVPVTVLGTGGLKKQNQFLVKGSRKDMFQITLILNIHFKDLLPSTKYFYTLFSTLKKSSAWISLSSWYCHEDWGIKKWTVLAKAAEPGDLGLTSGPPGA